MSQVLQPQAAEISAAPRTTSRELTRQLSYTITPTSAAGCAGNTFTVNGNSTFRAGRCIHPGDTDRLFRCSYRTDSLEHEQQHGRNDLCMDKG